MPWSRSRSGTPSTRNASPRSGTAIGALLAPTALAGAPGVAVSGVTGEGIDALVAALVGLRDRALADGAGAPGPARMAVDRVFGVKGRGTVVTGTLRGGPVARGSSAAAGARRGRGARPGAAGPRHAGGRRRSRRATGDEPGGRRAGGGGPRGGADGRPGGRRHGPAAGLPAAGAGSRGRRDAPDPAGRPEPPSGSTWGRPRSRASSGAPGATSTTSRTAGRRRSCGWRRRSRWRRAIDSCCAARPRPSRSRAGSCWTRGRPPGPRGAARRPPTWRPSRAPRRPASGPRRCSPCTGRCRGRGPRSGRSRRAVGSWPAGSSSPRRSRPS